MVVQSEKIMNGRYLGHLVCFPILFSVLCLNVHVDVYSVEVKRPTIMSPPPLITKMCSSCVWGPAAAAMSSALDNWPSNPDLYKKVMTGYR